MNTDKGTDKALLELHTWQKTVRIESCIYSLLSSLQKEMVLCVICVINYISSKEMSQILT